MVKAPEQGRVKTRLGHDIGAVAATRFFRSTLRNVIERLAVDPRWETVLAVAPDGALGSPVWPCGPMQISQGRGDLGGRMWRVAGLPRNGPVLIVGTDIPGLCPGVVADAFDALAGADAVLGSAGDGGYWCVGFSRTRAMRNPFAGVRWSGPHAMADTISGFRGQRVASANAVEDVDDGADFNRLGAVGTRRVLSVQFR